MLLMTASLGEYYHVPANTNIFCGPIVDTYYVCDLFYHKFMKLRNMLLLPTSVVGIIFHVVFFQEFIRNNPSQSQPLLQAILQTPSLAGLLAPNFSPNASPDLFTAMYEDMIPVPTNQGPEVTFTLLTKVTIYQRLYFFNATQVAQFAQPILFKRARQLGQSGQQ